MEVVVFLVFQNFNFSFQAQNLKKDTFKKYVKSPIPTELKLCIHKRCYRIEKLRIPNLNILGNF